MRIISLKELRFRILDLFCWIPDKLWLKILFKIKNGYVLDLEQPKSFCEKLQWLKLYGFKPEYTQMVDKYAVKEYVSKIIGSEFIIPTLGVWEKTKEIEWDTLPEKFVLKTTHGGGSCGVVICKDKNKLNRKKANNELNKSMSFTAGNSYREHPYMGVKKRIIAEKLIENKDGSEICDYKFYCFNGEPKYCQVIRDRQTKETIDFYDMDWCLMPFVGLNPKVNNGDTPAMRPYNLEEMKQVCRKLSKNIPFVRIDLYEVNKKIYFGEITFYPASGFGRFKPADWDYKLGELITI